MERMIQFRERERENKRDLGRESEMHIHID